MTYSRHFEETARRFADRTAFRMKTPDGYHGITYGDAYRRASAVARSLIARGITPGDRVAILSENRLEWAISYLGIYLARATVVPIDAQISPAEWRRLLDHSEAKMAFVSGSLLPKLKKAIEDSPLTGGIVCFDAVPANPGAEVEMAEWIESGAAPDLPTQLPESRPSDVAVLIYTSGTTGTPKGVMLTQGNILGDIVSMLKVIRADDRDVFLCLLPLHHVFASVVSFLAPIYLGGQVVFADTLKRSEILQALEEAGITILATVPQFFYLFHGRIEEELARKPPIARRLFRAMMRFNRFTLKLHLNLGRLFFGRIHHSFGGSLRLFVSGGSAFDPKVAQEFYDLGFTILQGYGLTETTGACTVTRVEDNVVGSVGKPLPGAEIRILEPGEDGVGEIAIRGTMVMKGYYKDPEGTAKALQDGWFLSGDLGRIDPEGNLHITGRKKEVVVLPSGKNIYPDEIEAHYSHSPYIKEIAVLGIADSRESGERLHAVVVPDFDYLKSKKIANAREILRDDIARWSNQLPQYKRLMSYQIQKDPLPRTTTRKIKRLELKRLIESGELAEAEAAGTPEPISAEDRERLESPIGEEVLATLRESYHRNMAIEPDMNLELDLGFDSMERVELMSSLEGSLGVTLGEDFGAEIYTVRDLIRRLEEITRSPGLAAAASRQNWGTILSEESLRKEGDWKIHFSGTAVNLFKYVVLRIVYAIFKLFFRLEVRGRKNLPERGTFLICPNHLSYLDPLVLLSALPYGVFVRTFFVGASELFDSFSMRVVARLSNTFPVDPDAHLLRAMKVGAYGLRSGRVLCIFPEGARSFDGRLKEFKKGAAILSREVRVPMVPAGIRGTYEALPRGRNRLRLHKIRIDFGAPLEPAPTEDEDPYRTDTDRLHAAVADLLHQ